MSGAIRQWSPIVSFCNLRCRGVQPVNRKLSNLCVQAEDLTCTEELGYSQSKYVGKKWSICAVQDSGSLDHEFEPSKSDVYLHLL